MTLADLVFGILAATAVASGWRVFRTASMVRASFLLLLSFVAAAGIMMLLAAPYIGVATIFMMAVEMMVMALFMVMFMMNPAGLNPMSMVHQQRLAVAAGVLAFVGLAAATWLAEFPDHPVGPAQPVIRDLGLELLGDSMLIFETAGVTLLATMIGAVVLSARSGRFGAADAGSVPPGLEPGGKPAGRVPEKKDGGMHGMDHGGMDPGAMDHGGMDHGDMDHGDMDHGDMDHGDKDHGSKDHGGKEHGGMDHGGKAPAKGSPPGNDQPDRRTPDSKGHGRTKKARGSRIKP